MQNVTALYKKAGETPLQCLDRFRKGKLEYENAVLTYAGRLDPLAEGVLLALSGDEAKRKDMYLGLPKEYEVEILFGASTDTGDCLGLVCECDRDAYQTLTEEKIKKIAPESVRAFDQPYPAYSSRTVSGKPLFEWAREGRLDEISIPKKRVEITAIEVLGSRMVSADDLKKEIEQKITAVSGDFRQKECLASWQMSLGKNTGASFFLATIRVSCGSGTYMRILAETIGKRLNTAALAHHIVRTRVGEFGLKDAIIPS